MDNIYYTYAYLREDGTPYYIGKGKEKRAFVKHGRGRIAVPPKGRILFLKRNLTEAEAFKHEVYMIAVFGRKDLGTGILRNFTDGGEGASNPSEETRKKRGAAIKGIKRSEKTRRKMSLAMRGLKRSEEGRKNISESKKGTKASPETLKKMSEAHSGSRNGMHGKTHSKETREWWSNKRKGRRWWNDGCGRTTQSVECPGPEWVPGRNTLKQKQ
jgi:hypothetical protein